MDRSNSTSSTSSKSGAASGPFAYQTRLLERTSSRGGGSLSRSNSQSSMGLLTNPNGGSATPSGTRRWTPSHRVASSLDAVRGKWEERAREASDEAFISSSSPMEGSKNRPPTLGSTQQGAQIPSPPRSSEHRAPISQSKPLPSIDQQKMPTYLKRHTMPTPIIASPLSPNTTGVTVEADLPSPPFATPTSHRIHLPVSTAFQSSSISNVKQLSEYAVSSPKTDQPSPPSRIRRSSTVEAVPSRLAGSLKDREILFASSDTPSYFQRKQHSSATTSPVEHRPSSLHGSLYATPPSPEKIHRPLSRTLSQGNGSTTVDVRPDHTFPPTPPSSATPVVSPSPYKSSYMSSKKASTYGNNSNARRQLGRHLPRIASGDGEVDWHAEEGDEIIDDSEKRQRRTRVWDDDVVSPLAMPIRQELVIPGVTDVDNVAGVPGRLRLVRDSTPSSPSSPLPSSRLTRGHWTDVQRHLLQAYEYLCHVGEAQQWIEGCLGEELGFGVVEMEDGLRNGVVLAKLVRVFQGEGVVRKIYEAAKLDFRHSDNINYFFNFVRDVGLPEGFIFELTDLYEKKNLPKVIYCIHALSHLLARRGMAERIGNLLGYLKFSDDQLHRTQKGLKDAGVIMPNFGDVGRELAIKINEEPEVEVETDDERLYRLLLANASSIVATQAFARGCLIRKAQANFRVRMRLAERHVPKLQARCRGALVRRRLEQHRQARDCLLPWVLPLQAAARAIIVRNQWKLRLRRIQRAVGHVIKVQAQVRGVLQRRHFARLKAALQRSSISVTKLQSLARARIIRNAHNEVEKTLFKPAVYDAIVALQAQARRSLVEKRAIRQMTRLKCQEPHFIALQAHCRGVLMRRRMRTQMAKLEDVTHVVIRIQAAVRTYLARKRLLSLIRGLRKATPTVVSFQARARANLTRQRHENLNKALSEASTIVSVDGFQALARASLARNRHRELNRCLEFVAPDVVGFQATSRRALIRRDYSAWRDHLWRSQPVASLLQAMLRGALQRRNFRIKMEYYRANLTKVVKIQSLFRAKETREQYRQLTLGKNVTVGTIKNFVHLLDDSEADFQDEIKLERLRKKVVESIRENQALENDVNDLDVKIALVVQNVKSFEEVIKARRKHGADSAAAHAARASLLAAHGDPFSGPNTLDHAARHKLELYQQLFWLLQTRGEYLSRLFIRMSLDSTPEKNRRFTERVVLTLFGYGQDRREHYLLLKLFQLAIRDEVSSAADMAEIIHGHPMYINIAVQYVRPQQMSYARESLQAIIREVVQSNDLDLEADPCLIHRSRIEIEEMRSGLSSSKRKDVSFHEALKDPDTRAEYIRHLQVLQWWTEAFVTAITQSTKKMPYGMRFLARETLISLRDKFPNAPDEAYAACIGRLVYYRYINPAIITPETFDIVSKTVDIAARKNLAQISKILTQITSGSEFDEDNPSYIPINDYVRKAIMQMSAWLIEVADVPDAESQFHAHEFLDATVQPKQIYISPNEIYAVHGMLAQHQEYLAPNRDDTLNVILTELDGVPNFGNEELKDARDQVIALELTNRFAHVRDPHADEQALWVQAKRGVLAILRVQPAQDLVESLMRPVTEEDELLWEMILENEMENEQGRQIPRRQPSTSAGESAYRLEDIRSLKFGAVKALAISFLLELENQGKITRSDGFQGILNAIAGDVRSKHRKRLQRQQEMENMNDALRHLAERKKYFEEQIDSYHNYVETAMNTMQRGKGKKRFVLPFTKQYFHLRDLQKSGETPQFGSFLYTAKYLYEKGILLSIDQYSPRQFDKIQLTMSSNTAGVFTLVLESNLLGVTSRLASDDIRMDDLLQAKFEKRASFSLFNGIVKVNLDLFIYQINKKFYV